MNSCKKSSRRKPMSSGFMFDMKTALSRKDEDVMLPCKHPVACASKRLLLKDHLELYPCLTCMKIKGMLKSCILRENSIEDAVKTMAKPFPVDPENGQIKYCLALAGFCTKQLPLCKAFWGFQNVKLIFDSFFLHLHHPRGSKLDLQHGSYPIEECEYLTDTKVEATKTISCGYLKEVESAVGREVKTSLRSLFILELSEPHLGWPLRKINPADRRNLTELEEGTVSRKDWIQSGSKKINSTSVEKEKSFRVNQHYGNKKLNGCWIVKKENIGSTHVSNTDANFDGIESVDSKPGWPLLQISVPGTIHSSIGLRASDTLVSQGTKGTVSTPATLKELKFLVESNSPGCRWFKYEELKLATNQFSSDNLIGEGGSSYAFKGKLDGKQVAVKLFKSYNEARKDFSLEIDIVSSLNHPYIMPLVGLCVEESHLISVYDYFPRGSLEDNLHDAGQQNQPVLRWNLRYNIAVAVAQSLNYLHNECSWPIIHRDIKSSNILLSDEFHPQLSDFGLSVREPANSTSIIYSEVVGTFGYIAPEYIIQGSITSKVDIYSFGVFLLELLSGRRAIYFDPLGEQKSLVQWAKLKLEGESFEDLVDPKLKGAFDPAQIDRMIMVANLCIDPSPHLRPSASQILDLLTEMHEIDKISAELMSPGNEEQYQDFTSKTWSSESDILTIDTWEPVKEAHRRKKLQDYLKEPED